MTMHRFMIALLRHNLDQPATLPDRRVAYLDGDA